MQRLCFEFVHSYHLIESQPLPDNQRLVMPHRQRTDALGFMVSS